MMIAVGGTKSDGLLLLHYPVISKAGAQTHTPNSDRKTGREKTGAITQTKSDRRTEGQTERETVKGRKNGGGGGGA